MLKLIRNLDTILDAEAYQQVYLANFMIISRPDIAVDWQKSYEIDKLHSETFENMLEDIRNKKEKSNLFDYKYNISLIKFDFSI